MIGVHKTVHIRRFFAGVLDLGLEFTGGLLGSYFGAMLAALVMALRTDSPTDMQDSIWNGVGFGFVFWMFSISFLNRVLIQGVSRSSIGKKIVNIELVSAVGPLTWGTMVKRWVLSYVSLVMGGAGYVYALFNKEGHTFHDIITGTDVIPLFSTSGMQMEHLETLVGEPRVPNMARITSMAFIMSNVQSERPESNVIQLPVVPKPGELRVVAKEESGTVADVVSIHSGTDDKKKAA